MPNQNCCCPTCFVKCQVLYKNPANGNLEKVKKAINVADIKHFHPRENDTLVQVKVCDEYLFVVGTFDEFAAAVDLCCTPDCPVPDPVPTPDPLPPIPTSMPAE